MALLEFENLYCCLPDKADLIPKIKCSEILLKIGKNE